MTTREIKIIISGRDQASGALGKVGSALGSMGNIAGGILGAQIFSRIAGGLVNMGREAINQIANFEQLSLSMETLVARELRAEDSTLSMSDALAAAGPKAQDLLGWIEQLAIKSPFSQEGVAVAFRTALSYGFTADEAQRLTNNLINMAAGSGQTVGVMNQVALALGQVQAKGKLAGQEILQLINAGVPVNDILSDMGFTLDDVSKGLVDAETFLEAFNQTMEDDFAGAAERGSNTLGGLLESIGDLKAVGLRELFEGILEPFREPLGNLVDFLNTDEFLSQLNAIGNSIGEFFAEVIGFFTETDFAALWADLVPPSIQEAIDGVLESVDGLIAAFEEKSPQFEQAANDIWAHLTTTLEQQTPQILENVSTLIDTITGIWVEDGDGIINAVANIINQLITIFVGGFTFISGLVVGALQALTGDFDGAWQTIQESTQTFADGILQLIGTSLEEFNATWETALFNLGVFVGLKFLEIKEKIEGFATDFKIAGAIVIASLIEAFTEKIPNMVTAGSDLIQGLWSGMEQKIAALSAWLAEQAAALVRIVESVLGIESPSSVFERIGVDMMRGLEQGLQRGVQAPRVIVTQSANDLRRAARDEQINSRQLTQTTTSRLSVFGGLHLHNVQSEQDLFDQLNNMAVPG